MVVDDQSRHKCQHHEADRSRSNIKIVIVDGPPKHKHVCSSSNSSYNDQQSHNHQNASRADKRSATIRSLLERVKQQHGQAGEKMEIMKVLSEMVQEDKRLSELRAQIEKANAKIASRQAVPVVSIPALKKESPVTESAEPTAQAKGQAQAQAARNRDRDWEQEMLNLLQKLDIRERAREKQAKENKVRLARRKEEEAQRHRLMQRIYPVGRHHVGLDYGGGPSWYG
ncbi:hypothetical protein E4U21_003078 [Claviceps maximensis]|nr:hypothetical protein E4U21_003078 [Claviceps maximensis]